MSAQQAAAGSLRDGGVTPGRAAGDLARLLAPLLLAFLPGLWDLRSRGEGRWLPAEAVQGAAAWKDRELPAPCFQAGREGSGEPGDGKQAGRPAGRQAGG